MKNERGGKAAVIVLGFLIVIFAVFLAVYVTGTGKAKLSQEKMQAKVEAAEKAEEERKNARKEEASDGEETHTASIEAFAVNGTSAAVAGGGKKSAESDEKKEKEEEEYLCSDSSQRLLDEEDVQKLQQGTYENLPQGKGIIQMAVNEIYAKNGYQFENSEIQAYFEEKEWYRELAVRNSDMNEVMKNMTETERKNVEFLSVYIEE